MILCDLLHHHQMVSSIFLDLFSRIFAVVAWPSFALLLPLGASIWALEADLYFENGQCLNFWVLFSLTKILETALWELLKWVPFWPYVKGLAILLLTIPYFVGAAYVYKCFIRPVNLQICSILYHRRKQTFEQNGILDAAEVSIEENGFHEENPFIKQRKLEAHDETARSNYCCATIDKKVQKEWSCALCLVNTTSEQCLQKHQKGKKHKAMEEELRANAPSTKAGSEHSKLTKRSNSMIVLQNLNQIAWVNLEKWTGLLSPVAHWPNSIRWCRWRKPGFGWTKLNTDGSVDPENASFGGLLRDHLGNPICAYVCKAHGDDVFLVELWAVWRGLILALSLGIRVVWIESDSLSVVKTIKKEQPYGLKAGRCLKRIWELLCKFEKYQVSHSWREANRAADHLSKMDILGSDMVLWPADFSSSLCSIIKDDAQGRRYRRG